MILAIDQSTSATKALLYDSELRLVDKVSREHQQIYPQPGYVEHDAEEIWQNTLAVCREILMRQRSAIPLFIALTNQRETIVVFDRRTGQPLCNAIVWQCRRGEPICVRLAAAGGDSTVAQATGLKLDTYFSASKLTWIIRNKPEIAARLAGGDALAGTIDTYLIYRLTGGKVFATEPTNASRTLLYDIHRRCWSPDLCGMFDVPAGCLPEVRGCDSAFGQTDLSGALPAAIPIRGVMGDSQAALFAHGCFTSGEAKVTFGTGSSVLLTIGSEPELAEGGVVTTMAWVLGGKPTYCAEGIINYSAAVIAWLKDQLGLIHSLEQTAEAAEVPDTGGVYLVPAFAGLGAPWWQPRARAAIVGMSAGTDRRHIIRAATESIAYQLRDVLEMMNSCTGVSLRAIHADGGASGNAFLMQLAADITGVEIQVSNAADCSPLGAAMMGALGQSIYRDLDELPRQPGRAYRPRMDRADADRLYAGWKRAVAQVISGIQETPLQASVSIQQQLREVS